MIGQSKESINSLKQFLMQEIQALRDDMVTKLQSLEDSPSETSDAEPLDARLPKMKEA